MDLVEYQSGIKTRHPWELSRFNLFSRLLKQHGLTSKKIRVLDVGSGDAWFASQLALKLPPGSTITCWDKGYSDSQLVEKLSQEISPGLTLTSEQPLGKFDLVLLMDVLEHVDQDEDFLKQIVDENMTTDSSVLISVPAWQALFSAHDELLPHYRRYSPKQISAVIKKTNLKIDQRGTIFSSLLIFRSFEVLFAKMLGRKRTAQLEDWKANRFLTVLTQSILEIDGRLGFLLSKFGIDYFGLSWWAMCKK